MKACINCKHPVKEDIEICPKCGGEMNNVAEFHPKELVDSEDKTPNSSQDPFGGKKSGLKYHPHGDINVKEELIRSGYETHKHAEDF